ncbi:YdaU family protein [Oligella urethralis]|nr:YdaU family protein [Oligella urethralis]
MMTKIEFDIIQWRAETRHLSLIEAAVYFELIGEYLIHKGNVKADISLLQKRIGAKSEAEKQAVEYVLEEFFTLAEDGLRYLNPDLDELINSNATHIENQNVADKTKGSDQLWPTVASPTPRRKKTIETAELVQAFNTFWEAGMVKTGKQNALKSFKSVLKTTDLDSSAFAEMLAKDIKTRLASNQYGFSKMHPATYLNGRRWEDQLIEDDTNYTPCGLRKNNFDDVDYEGDLEQNEDGSYAF